MGRLSRRIQNMRKVILVRSNQIQSDSRVEKYINFFESTGIHYEILAWDRIASGIEMKHAHYYRKKVGYVVGGGLRQHSTVYFGSDM